MTAGRIEIDDVQPVVSEGRFPAKAVIGEIVPVTATVWREGHDAVSATLVVRYHGTGYPPLADEPPGRVRPTEAVPIQEVVKP
ncbi:MAG: maltotransferase domain-containing protein, partial [Mycolicibacterium sp.]